ncbi:VOC family protein [Sporolactobacillus vineae]|uniref:VOC family protein n=1 Tax=Sporolactobacillus vineae TaxID=444463 RepID=UPI000289083F|nr:VOC family protein [Sporolactobacillus vineae]
MALSLTPYLVMNGNAGEAIQFYEKALDAKVTFKQTFSEMPANPDFPLPEAAKNLISHAMIKIGDSDLMFSDNFPGQSSSTSGNQVTICITSDSKEQTGKSFDTLSEGGQVVMPLQETFFSPAYGIVTDKFGITFQFFTEGKN